MITSLPVAPTTRRRAAARPLRPATAGQEGTQWRLPRVQSERESSSVGGTLFPAPKRLLERTSSIVGKLLLLLGFVFADFLLHQSSSVSAAAAGMPALITCAPQDEVLKDGAG